jgi:hypothetical protein
MKQASLFVALVFSFAPAFAQVFLDDAYIVSDSGVVRQYNTNTPLIFGNSGIGSPSLAWRERAVGDPSPLSSHNPHSINSSASLTANGVSSQHIYSVYVDATWNDLITIGGNRAGASGAVTVQFYNNTLINFPTPQADLQVATGLFQTVLDSKTVDAVHSILSEHAQQATDYSATEYYDNSFEVSRVDGFTQLITETVPFTVGVPIALQVVVFSSVNLTCDVICNIDNMALGDSSDLPEYGWYWGGIKSIDINGEQAAGSTFDGFTVVSASGLDYTKSYIPPVPEQPGWIALIMGGLLVFFFRRQRHFRAQQSERGRAAGYNRLASWHLTPNRNNL